MKDSNHKNKTVLIIAGEASGDMHGANLVREMLNRDPALKFYGIGGKKMLQEGVQLLADASTMAVVGLTEVVFKLKDILKIMRTIKKSLDERRPDLVVLIDYPDFNLPVAKAARRHNIKVLYYISPQVWAWRQSRIEQIKKTVTRMAVILPFEVETYRRHGFAADYVGHPLLDMIKTTYSKKESRKKFDLHEDKITIGILPGSRMSEIKKLLPELLQAATIMKDSIPELQFVVPLADTLEEKNLTGIIAGFPIDVNVISGQTYDVVSCADLALVASGTATLETALLKVPMIIVYKISPLSYFIGKLFVRVKNIGLVNIIAEKTIVPELIQNDASGARIAREALSILGDETKKQAMIRELEAIRSRLGEPGAAIKTAKLALDML
ncbi:MAG TPA: lipid-A-disaccharide synthase [Smithella sp.]|jgi:lipid-A-disaccharide synthase|nr:lipid-A-disaccharide synthase [Deltaproteobacteria bacterium]OQC51431.1 MAG: Lipid-A-disaccharide synthase [Deltaproteobacteria bacterium ADurb.Bin022]HNQ64685.1 lipid-A-disaccharide synthase [Smithella sp.]HOE33280.1 lipid-A-disaccharide synthase [Smithella sp.]HOG10631.1 lipid-A-disaccharide synthase [Smithella sp.]